MYTTSMRTTIEIRDEHRARLLALAARRGEKGFSKIVEEALEKFLLDLEARDRAQRLALGARGALSEDEANELELAVREVREHWR